MLLTIGAAAVLLKLINMLAFYLTNPAAIMGDAGNIILWLLSVFSVVIIGFFIAYLLDPSVMFLENIFARALDKYKIKRKSRLLSVLAVYLIAGLILSCIISYFIAKVGAGESIIENITTLVNTSLSEFVSGYYSLEPLLRRYGLFEYGSYALSSLVNIILGFMQSIGNSFINFITGVGKGILNVMLGAVIAFYLLKDKKKLLYSANKIGNIVLKDKNRYVKEVLKNIDTVFSGFIRGQLTDAFIMSLLIGSVLTILGVKYAVIIGITAGFSNIIPYFGAIIGMIMAVLASLMSGAPIKAVYAAAAMLILQQIDSIIIVPRVVGDNVKLSPVVVLAVLTIFGKIFGVWGMVFAVPITAVLKALIIQIYHFRVDKK